MTFLATNQTSKERNSYILKVETVSSDVNEKTVHTGYRTPKVRLTKTVAVLGILLMTLMGIGTGLTVVFTSTPTDSQAQAFDFFDPNTWFCKTKDSLYAPLGGSNGVMEHSATGATRNYVGGEFLNVPVEEGQKTALEMYGYWAPSYETWTGIYTGQNLDSYTWLGTGGAKGVNSYGDSYKILDPSRSFFYSSNGMPDCFNPGGGLNSGLGNMVSGLPKFLVALSGEIYGWATTTTLTDENSPLYPVAKGVETMIVGEPGQPGLKDLLFLDFLTPLVLLAAGWFFWQGIVKRSTTVAFQGIIWTVLAAIGAIMFLVAPLKVAEGIDFVVNGVNSAIVGAINETGNTGEYCSLPDSAQNKDARVVKCALWYSLVYSPWVNGQFGYNQYNLANNPEANSDEVIFTQNKSFDFEAGDVDGEEGAGWENVGNITSGGMGDSRGVLVVDSFAPDYRLMNEGAMLNWPYYQMHVTSGYEKYAGLSYSEIAFNQIIVNGNSDWRIAGGAIGSAFTGLFAAILPTAAVLSISITILGYQIMMLMLIALAPLFFLLGVAPGWGRRIAMRWVELVVGVLVKRIMLVLFLAIYLRLLMTILGVEMDWLFQMILVGILSMVAISQRGKFIEIFTNAIDFGGDKSVAADGRVNARVAQMAGSAFRSGSNVVRKGVIAGGEGAGSAGRMIKSNVTSGSDTSSASQARRDAKLGLTNETPGSKRAAKAMAKHQQDPLAALGNVSTAADINVRRLNSKELGKITKADGTLNNKKAEKWLNKTKAKTIGAQQSINNDYRANLQSREAIKKEKNLAERAKAMDANRREREAIRKRQAEQNKTVRRIFGEENTSFETGAKANLATRYKPSKKYRK